jgi:hypothetical protein
MKKRIIIAVLIILGVFISIWLGAIVKCEILTNLHGNEFTDGYKRTNMLNKIDYLKVLNYSDTTARIYYVSKGVRSDIIKFVKKDGEWELDKWERTVWDSTGSADGTMWPYFYDSPDGRFKIIIYGVPSLIVIIILVRVLVKNRRMNELLYHIII